MLSSSFLIANEAKTSTKANKFDFTTIEGKKITLVEKKDGFKFSGLNDKNVIVLFYIYSGKPCRDQLQLFTKMKSKYSDLEFLTFELKGLTPDKLKDFEKELSLKGLHMVDSSQALPFASYMSQRMGWQGSVPLLLITDKSGVVKHTQLGAMDEAQINEIVKKP
jgi:peroxiredoxin